MLFLAFYEVSLDKLDEATAKRLEWDTAAPESMKIVGEWVQHGSSEAVRGCVVFESTDPADVQALILYYGTTVKFDVRPASDVSSALERTRELLDGPGRAGVGRASAREAAARGSVRETPARGSVREAPAREAPTREAPKREAAPRSQSTQRLRSTFRAPVGSQGKSAPAEAPAPEPARQRSKRFTKKDLLQHPEIDIPRRKEDDEGDFR